MKLAKIITVFLAVFMLMGNVRVSANETDDCDCDGNSVIVETIDVFDEGIHEEDFANDELVYIPVRARNAIGVSIRNKRVSSWYSDHLISQRNGGPSYTIASGASYGTAISFSASV